MKVCRFGLMAALACCFAGDSHVRSLAIEANPQQSSVAQSPQESLKKIAVDPGLNVELVACEPNIMSPVAMRFDEDGRLWVVQMRDYPTGPTKEYPARSRLSILEDKDGDGFYESATVFADNLPFATGVQPWKGGAFVTMSGKVQYLKDTNGDGKADAVETWYTGFAEGNQQLRANHPRFALDNHIYIANGLRGGTIIDPMSKGAKPVSISGRDFRFDPRTRAYEGVSGMGQFGLTFDDYGNRFECSNRNPAYHIVLEEQMLKKNPLVAVGAVVHDVAKPAEESRLYSIGKAWVTSNLHQGQFTAACGIDIYRGDALPMEYYGCVYTCDPTARVVHREIMQPDGVTFTSNRLPEHSEFFASGDEWTCPVNLEVGPDGAMYVVDMYRQVIEHPQWMPEELQHRRNLRAGADRGRIYRVAPKDTKRRERPQFSKLTSEQLVEQLANPNVWQRETAQRLLMERDDASVGPQLAKMMTYDKSPLAQIHAMRTLQGLGLLTEPLVLHALNSLDPRVQEQAILVCDSKLGEWKMAQAKIARLVESPDARVRYQALLVGMPMPQPPLFPADQWELDAMLIASRGRSGDVLAAMLADPKNLQEHIKEPKKFIVELARQAAGSRNSEEYMPAISALIGNREYERAGLTGFLSDMSRSGLSLDYVRAKLGPTTSRRLDRVFEKARNDAADTKQAEASRCDAVDLLAFAPGTADLLTNLALKDSNQLVRLRAIASLAKMHDYKPWPELLGHLSAMSPVEQRAVLDSVFISVERSLLLLDEIENGRLKATLIDPIHAKLLLDNRDQAIRMRSQKVLASAIPADREKVLAEYRKVLTMNADPAHGQEIFRKNCSICHQINGIGVRFAPDISDSREKSPEQILTDVIEPNRAIDSNYFSYTAITTDGRTHTGVLASETSTSVVLKQQEGKSETLRRDEIESLQNNGVSFMPEGLEKNIPLQDMADLISFIKNWRYLESAQGGATSQAAGGPQPGAHSQTAAKP